MSRKRSNGTGTVYEDRTRGGWVAQVRYVDQRTGRTKSVKRRRRTQEEAWAVLPELREGISMTRADRRERLRVGAMLAEWTDSKTSWSPATRRRHLHYHAHLGKLSEWYADEVTADDIDALLRDLAKQGVSPDGLRRLRQDLANAWDRAVARGKVADRSNPARLADLPEDAPAVEPTEERGKALTLAQVNAMVAASGDRRLGAVIPTALYTGLRPGELRMLRWEALDLGGGTLTVLGQFSTDEDGRSVEGRLKTQKAYRVLRLPAVVLEALTKHRDRQAEEEALGVWPERWAGYVFRTQVGTPIDAANLRRLFRDCAKDAGLDWMPTPYDARKTFTTLLIEEYCVPHHRVADVLGHRDLRMIERHYRKSITPVADAAVAFDRV